MGEGDRGREGGREREIRAEKAVTSLFLLGGTQIVMPLLLKHVNRSEDEIEENRRKSQFFWYFILDRMQQAACFSVFGALHFVEAQTV